MFASCRFEAMRFCGTCGFQLKDSYAYCGNCGGVTDPDRVPKALGLEPRLDETRADALPPHDLQIPNPSEISEREADPVGLNSELESKVSQESGVPERAALTPSESGRRKDARIKAFLISTLSLALLAAIVASTQPGRVETDLGSTSAPDSNEDRYPASEACVDLQKASNEFFLGVYGQAEAPDLKSASKAYRTVTKGAEIAITLVNQKVEQGIDWDSENVVISILSQARDSVSKSNSLLDEILKFESFSDFRNGRDFKFVEAELYSTLHGINSNFRALASSSCNDAGVELDLIDVIDSETITWLPSVYVRKLQG